MRRFHSSRVRTPQFVDPSGVVHLSVPSATPTGSLLWFNARAVAPRSGTPPSSPSSRLRREELCADMVYFAPGCTSPSCELDPLQRPRPAALARSTSKGRGTSQGGPGIAQRRRWLRASGSSGPPDRAARAPARGAPWRASRSGAARKAPVRLRSIPDHSACVHLRMVAGQCGPRRRLLRACSLARPTCEVCSAGPGIGLLCPGRGVDRRPLPLPLRPRRAKSWSTWPWHPIGNLSRPAGRRARCLTPPSRRPRRGSWACARRRGHFLPRRPVGEYPHRGAGTPVTPSPRDAAPSRSTRGNARREQRRYRSRTSVVSFSPSAGPGIRRNDAPDRAGRRLRRARAPEQTLDDSRLASLHYETASALTVHHRS